MGMDCFVSYNFPTPSNVFAVNTSQVQALVDHVSSVASSSSVVPAVRVPLCASSWLGIPTNSSQNNMAK